MKRHPALKSFNLERWLAENRDSLKPPVGNKLLHEGGDMIVMVVGGPNTRVDFHDDPVEEWFYQIRGDMLLKIAADGDFYDVPIREGDVFFLPAHVRHAPQRPMEGSVGIVVESPRPAGSKDAFEWYCFNCKHLVHRAEVELGGASGIVDKLPGIFAAFHEDESARTCANCGELHPGKGQPPEGWVTL